MHALFSLRSHKPSVDNIIIIIQSVESPAQYAEITNRVYVEIEKTSAKGNRPVPPQYDDIVQYTEVSKVPQNKSRTRKTGV